MSGETEQSVSGWTTDTLHSHVLSLVSEQRVICDMLQAQVDRRLEHVQLQVDQRFEATQELRADLKDLLNERYATQTKALDAAFKAAEQAVAVALANAEKATIKAEVAAETRFTAVNEFREQLQLIINTFMTRVETEARLTGLSERVADMREDLTRIGGQVVPRNETETWRTQMLERITALELRLTSRLDLNQGEHTGGERQDTERRLDIGVVLQLLAVLISIAAIITVIVRK